MKLRIFPWLLVPSLVAAFALPQSASGSGQAPAPRIAWFDGWKAGLAEAKRTGRPILLIAAAPHCHNVFGIW